jgi:ABC-type lipoprotein release transport system permease subunit
MTSDRDKQRERFWFKTSIIAAVVIVVGVFGMIIFLAVGPT